MLVASAGAVALLASWVAWAEPVADPEADVPAEEPTSVEAEAPAETPVEDTPVAEDEPAYGPAAAYGSAAEAPAAEPEGERRVVVVTPRPAPERDQAASVISREELTERLPRSAPDALRGEPGVYIQQTAHGQASPYVRGLTGQQTVMFFDGVRLNNSTFRQGPNQYFFTIDSRTVDHLEIQRGSASTRYGSDAIGGALLASPIEPRLEPGKTVVVHPLAIMRVATADAEVGGRAQTSISVKGKLGVIVGAGYRNVGQLRTGGRVIEPGTGEPQKVPPIFGPDGKTQLGTGFRELTDDARVVWQPNRRHRVTLGYYDYRQYDAPRTDKCPPQTAPQDECLTYLEQFRTLVYGAYEAKDGPTAAEHARVTVSYGRQHELRQEDRGQSGTLLDGDDDVHTLGAGVVIDTHDFELAPWVTVGGRYGLDLYYDRLSSHQRVSWANVPGFVAEGSRGQYIDGSQYMTSGTWAQVQTEFIDRIRLRAGGRGAFVVARADGDEGTSSDPVHRSWAAVVGNVGVAADPASWLTLVFNVDQGFRAPNLDDLTAQQHVGPGFQIGNPSLRPEHSLSLEAGTLAYHRWFELEAFVFRTTITDFIQRDLSVCPVGLWTCPTSRYVFRPVNLPGQAVILGAEGGVRIHLPWDLGLRATISYAWGEGTNPQAENPMEPARVPLSRIPPLNGIVEAGWRSERLGLYLVGVLRWAGAQTRLAPQDSKDARIPEGGTPGYVVADLRAGYRLKPWILGSVVVENLADTPYKHHGSSTNGPGRGLTAELQFGF